MVHQSLMHSLLYLNPQLDMKQEMIIAFITSHLPLTPELCIVSSSELLALTNLFNLASLIIRSCSSFIEPDSERWIGFLATTVLVGSEALGTVVSSSSLVLKRSV